jgi:hypothetical protein
MALASLSRRIMARLMAVPIEGKGHSVLIVTQQAGVTLMGFVAQTSLRNISEHLPSMCECMAFVERHLPAFEKILLYKSIEEDYLDAAIACVEVGPADLAKAGLAGLRRT